MRYPLLTASYILIVSSFLSCRSTKPIATAPSLTQNEESYIENYKDIAVEEMRRYGVPASITLAQGMIESDFGRSRLAREANNHFGIKCHNGWNGEKIYHHDDRHNECFRKYDNPEDSFRDHSEFLKSGSRYAFLFSLQPTDYKGWAHGLKKAGYATNPDYANMLIRAIETRNLHYYDTDYKVSRTTEKKSPPVKEDIVAVEASRPVMPSSPVNENNTVSARVQRVNVNNGINYIIIRDGDTREGIEEEFQLLKWELARYNELDNNFKVVAGQMLYIQPKRDKAQKGFEFHDVVEGDTMYMISQHYGIKLKNLYKMNGMKEQSEPTPGERLWLRSNRPVN